MEPTIVQSGIMAKDKMNDVFHYVHTDQSDGRGVIEHYCVCDERRGTGSLSAFTNTANPVLMQKADYYDGVKRKRMYYGQCKCGRIYWTEGEYDEDDD